MLDYIINNKYPEIFCFTTTRRGGVSVGNYDSFNLSPYTGDDLDNFYKNKSLLSEKLLIKDNDIVIPYQTHESKVLVIDASFSNLSEQAKIKQLDGIDALVTNQRGICIGVTTADCVPVFVYDPIKQIIGIAHAGWKGTCKRIVQKTIQVMINEFECLPSEINAVIGPSISPEIYKVGEELITAFTESGLQTERIFQQKNEDLFLDLWQANKKQLLDSGVKEGNIEVSGICTYKNSTLCFSARRDGIRSGRMYSGIFLK